MDYYESYVNSDEGGKQFILRQMFAENAALKRQVDYLTQEVETLKNRPNHLQLIENRSRYPPQILHINSGKMSEKP